MVAALGAANLSRGALEPVEQRLQPKSWATARTFYTAIKRYQHRRDPGRILFPFGFCRTVRGFILGAKDHGIAHATSTS
jgi:hypothetical protein